MASYGKKILGAAVLVGASTLITGQVVSQQYEDQMDEMKQWMELAQPGEEHAEMAKWAGTWHQETKHWMSPGAPPEESTGTAEVKPILGGRFMLEKVKSQMQFAGEVHDFEGIGIFGFDRIQKKHVFVWVNNMSTLIATGEGTADKTGKVITYYSELPNPMNGGKTKVKYVSTVVNDDKYLLEMFGQHPDGSWFRNMEIVSTRKD